MNENPLMILLYVGVAAYVGNMYWGDYKASQAGQPNSGAMPGATSVPLAAYVIGVLGALLLLGVETGGEIALGVADEQSEMVWFFVFAIVAAGVVEEVIFRGFLVIENKGRALLIGSCVGCSLIFAIIHAHFWSTEDGFEWTFTSKAWLSTGILFANSLWFYTLRFAPWNPNRSIFPCMLAHAASNLGVFVVKLVQGYVVF
ncbi:CPBP family intramembrane metalloprotease [Coraliomargarita sp. SDUM461003]|uniref:CPBP family intramembrane metalloprotease n=1 Tax=Thalassobacterium maritimum TaxID=3041265 RepID=A0ABU1B129_9BACT|nr:CPBP family intramembrane glutamic endopeptidase [Coraliomargarita sp. SDUM461003]MBT61701.1 CPBP family intramembrane metalloprotease [Puniceicoccaceae bacterium]MDQ8209349.1 CPBP family intramembrane metalloprotease [Coraliomargarita sp. SDUM461003]HBR95425.1 CPBP family intramembrane metalloprotease [Opitutae bacterium]|tara:strand:- start:3198 stop:3800 length:603 start_codon:yes stop_codon:yes gene_type:complete